MTTRMLQILLSLLAVFFFMVSCGSKDAEQNQTAAKEADDDGLSAALESVSDDSVDDDDDDDDEDDDDLADEDDDDLEDGLVNEELGDGTTTAQGGDQTGEVINESLQADMGDEEDDLDLTEEGDDFDTASTSGAEVQGQGSGVSTRVTNLKYVSFKSGGTVVIETADPVKYRVRKEIDRNQVIIEIPNASLPQKFKRPYVTKDFQQRIASVNAYQNSGATTARIVVQLRGNADAVVEQQGRSLMVVSSKAPDSTDITAEDLESDIDLGVDGEGEFIGGDDETLEDMNEAEFSNEIDRELPETPVNAEVPVEEKNLGSDTEVPGQALSADEITNRPLALLKQDTDKFYGNPISIEVQNTEVRTVLNLIAEEAGVNMVLDDEVGGNVTLKLRQVPWDQALVLIMKSKGLSFRREGIVLRIAPEDKLRQEEEKARLDAEAKRIAENLKVKVIPVSYAKVSNLIGKVREFLSQRGKIAADERTSSLIVTDIQETIDRVSRLVKALDIPPLQVLIEGKVIEARESFGRVFGINFASSGAEFDIGGGAQFRPTLSVNPIERGSTVNGLSTGLSVGTFETLGDLTAFLGIFENEQMVKVVSSPRIVTLNNEQATISQKTQFPITQVQTSTGDEQAEQATVQFKDVELSLNVTPQITFEGNVILEVDVKRDFAGGEIDSSGAREVNVRQAKTKVLVRNGQTAVIGGIYQSDATEGERGVPWLRNVPILGNLFKARNITKEKNELLIFLTPRILNTKRPQFGDDTDLEEEISL